MRQISAQEKVIIPLGRQGENGAAEIIFDATGWSDLYGTGAFELLNRRPAENTPYTCSITVSDEQVHWIVQSADVALVGHGRCELTYVVDDVIAKSVVFATCVLPSIEGAGEVPEPYESRIQDLIVASAEAVIAAQDSEAYAAGTRNGADVPSDDPAYHNNSKYYSSRANSSANTAQGYASDAGQSAAISSASALKSEGYAAGTANGRAVADTSPYYHNNSKYYSEQASGSATAAAGSATAADESASAAAGSATAADESATAAAGSETAAAGSATAAAGSASAAAGSATAAAGSASDAAAQLALVTAEGTRQVGLITAEGTTQKNAVQAKGDEVIASIPSDYTELTEEVEDLKSSLTEYEDALKRIAWTQESISYVNSYYINVNVSGGTVVDIDNPTYVATMCYALSPCYKGDKFVITADTHGLTNPRVWGFLDTEKKLISKAASKLIVTALEIEAPADGYIVSNSIKATPHSLIRYYYYEDVGTKINNLDSAVENIEEELRDTSANNDLTDLVAAQKAISEDWHFSFINVFENMGLGANHLIPGTKTTWNPSGTEDLNQKGVWMRDGTHPFKGDGVTDMYARTIASQLAMVVPSYHDEVGETSPTLWTGRRILWMGTSIPAGSDPEAGEGTGATYPALVSTLLGSTSINKSKGSSCVRINASTGEYTGMLFPHFARALTRTVDECDAIAANWDSIKSKITYAPDTLSADNVTTMKNHSFENLLLPYLDGTHTMPDLFVIDHGHNDVRPKGIDGKNDLWITPSAQMITDGILAEDTYMTANNYANLKLALNNDLSGISDLAEFSATLNRNCFKGAVNFLITVILRYNPYARIAIISDYN